jgi:hypothetical protein
LTGLVQPVPAAGCTSGLAERNESGAAHVLRFLGATRLAGPGAPLREAPGGSYISPPAVIGTGHATKRISTGQWVRADGDPGMVTFIG